MGSGAKRMSNDQVRINSPRNQSSGGDVGGAGAGEGGKPIDSNNICPVAFHVKLTNQGLPAGLELDVNTNNEIELTQTGAVVGKLTRAVLKRIEVCAGMGVVYISTTVVDKKGLVYAEFKQA